MLPEKSPMTSAATHLQIAKASGFRPSDGGSAPGSGQDLRDLFAPLDYLLVGGGDPRLTLDSVSGVNEYGCGPVPSPETWNFASSTASSISERAYARAELAREELMRTAITAGVEEAFDARIEEMREELSAHLGLSAAAVDVVFSPSGTDSQLHALFLARSLLGSRLTTIVVGSDQTGSGTLYTARGRHFAGLTAGGRPVRKDTPIAGLSGDSVALPLIDGAGDAAVLAAIETAVGNRTRVLLQIMDCSKLGWRAPGEACLDEIARRWPDKVLVVVDACQMRLGRRRMRNYLDRGYLVLITGSKYFGGPAFSGALLVPSRLSRSLDDGKVSRGLLDYAGRSDWPNRWAGLRSRFESRPNFGQWLRWEAALEEIKAYYQVPEGFRALALKELGAGIQSLIALSPSLRLVAFETKADDADDEEFAAATIFPFMMERHGSPLSVEACRAVHRSLTHEISEMAVGSEADRQIAARRCLVGQPVRLQRRGGEPAAVLRLCIGARLVTEAWSAEAGVAQKNLQCELDRVAEVITKIELLLAHAGDGQVAELSYGF
jgi:selenocysteine lyase/cysteine desulfurase